MVFKKNVEIIVGREGTSVQVWTAVGVARSLIRTVNSQNMY